ncbi:MULTISPECIES: NADH-quinone oxidoreductase subunit J [unclassified Paenibacillus]|uniref:NADH-quinone oxidoreductase subunit J n=1 Tax=unclassified Paenibacillus TaxID=185978 RepID=UPI001C106C42|nr:MULTISPECIES: NADH-quinone oxidoreductase subunit J [unclassified Paenibacillus]MBU5440934.1 NADH-quinone oxidoreductase subunit J [Paenibacillus sp. MSJ-34]CAH0118066.1 NADH-quinone oxidoreductase subunit J [Paenibacillus sp. CECT 9249]
MFSFNLELTGEYIAFFILAVCIISGAVLMISFNKVVHMVVSLAFTFICLAGMYVLLNAEFVAFVQVLIYAGAISILMIFGIMMTRHDKTDEEMTRPWHEALVAVGCLALFGILFYAIRMAEFPAANWDAPKENTLEIGKLIFTEHVIPFELLSVLLTVAFIGAIVLAKKEAD